MQVGQDQEVDTLVFPTLKPSDIVYPLPLPAANDITDPKSQTSFGYNRTDVEQIKVNGKVVKTIVHHRKHAAVDLEAPFGTPVLAMADGVVIRKVKDFRQGTSAIEVQHIGFGIVRYGEVDAHALDLVHVGCPVKRGQVVGYLGKRGSEPRAMLHLEYYSDWTRTDLRPLSNDRLTNTSNPPFERRDDLKNPTAFLHEGLQITGLKHVKLAQPVVDTGVADWIRLQHLLSTVCVRLTCPVSGKQ